MEDNQRNCPNCEKIMTYSHKYKRNEAEKKGLWCASCARKQVWGTLDEDEEKAKEYECPICKRITIYSTKYNVTTAKKMGTLCRSCASKEVAKRDGVKERIQETRKRNNSDEVYRTPEAREANRQRNLGKKNAMYGRSVYDVWVEKYGKEKADKKMEKYKEKHRKNNSGKNNPMYGKPSPQGSGNGWSGHYKNFYFRSLKELSFIVNYIERFGFNYQSLERAKYKIKYICPQGQERNYFGDFLLNDKYFVEIKPKRLINSPNNKAKFEAAARFCKENGLIFKIIDPKVDFNQIKSLYLKGEIKLLEKYKKKMEEKLKGS